jgi:hypothetical protein
MLTKEPLLYNLFVEIKTGKLFRGDDDTEGFIKITSHHVFQPFSAMLLTPFGSLPRLQDNPLIQWRTNEMDEMKRDDECCNEKECKEKCTHVVYWPGENPPPKYCKKHAMRASKIADAMGLSVYWKEINDGGN